MRCNLPAFPKVNDFISKRKSSRSQQYPHVNRLPGLNLRFNRVILHISFLQAWSRAGTLELPGEVRCDVDANERQGTHYSSVIVSVNQAAHSSVPDCLPRETSWTVEAGIDERVSYH